MSTLNDLKIEDRLAALRKSYGTTLREKIECLQRTTRDFHLNNEKRTRTSLEEARALSHKLAGSAPTFGYARIGQLALALEGCIENIIANQAPPGENSRREVENLLHQIEDEEKQSRGSTASHVTPARRHRLQIAQGRHYFGREFLTAFERHGFDIRVNDEFEPVVLHADAFRPDALIIALDQLEVAGFELAERLWRKDACRSIEIFFFVKSQEFVQKMLLNGISDDWLISPPLDSQKLASRILRRIFNIKVGRESNNRPYLMPYLETFKRLAVPGSDPIISAPLTMPRSQAPSVPELEKHYLSHAKKKVLVIDDDRHLVEAIYVVLLDKGIEVLKAYSGTQGLQLATKEIPDLIITDFEMPNGSAEYLMVNLKKCEATKTIKVMVMTGQRVLEKYLLGNDPASYLNAISYQPKPIDLDCLCAEVKRHLAVM
jgi:DNA-binding response OmpR family regulator/HPt (histidine-containing phosphotransfer) domain-containing protein